MNNLVYILIALNVAVGVIAIYLSFRDEKQKNELEQQKKELIRSYYTVYVLYDISSKIGYSFNINSIAETIVLSVEKLFDLSTISFATLDNGYINIKNFQKEAVGKPYLQAVNKILTSSMYELNPITVQYQVNETSHTQPDTKDYSGVHYDFLPKSFFNIPLVVNDQFVGVITVTSRKPKAYDENDMTTLYKIVGQAEVAAERLQQIIENEKKKLATLISGIPSGAMLFVIDQDRFKLETINAAAKNFLGFRDSEDVDEFQLVGRFGPAIHMEKQIMDAVREKRSIILKDVQIQDKYFKIYINPIPFFNNETIDGVTVSLEDTTMERELAEIRDSFTNMVVHELRAPMTSIKGASELLLGDKLDDTDRKRMLRIVKDSSERMLTQINDLLDAAKLQAGKFQILEENSNLNQVASDRVEAFKFLADTKKIQISAEVDPALPEFSFDKIRIDQVITNLLSNALKFTPEGGSITVRTQRLNDRAQVSVTDTGAGIPADKQTMLFSKYAQVQTLFRKEGTGLGLYICKGIVESHGGKIWLESQEGKGTTMYFSLPLVQHREEAAPSAAAAAASAQQTPAQPAAHVN